MRLSINNREHFADPIKPRPIHVTDIMIIAALLMVSIVFIPFLRSHPSDTVEVYRKSDIIARYPLDENRIFYVEGLMGDLEVEIKDRRVRITSAKCPHQVCVDTGWISKTYEQIICAPNTVFVQIKSDAAEEEIDAVSH